MRSPDRVGRPLAALLLVALIAGCATQQPPDTARLEAAIARFEQAAAQAEAAAAQAEESARHAEAAAQAQEQRHCAEAERRPVRTAAQAARNAQAFLHCLGLSWGQPVAIVRVPKTPEADTRYRVEYSDERIVFVGIPSGIADLPARPRGD